MRKLVLTLAALAAVGLAVPVMTAPAEARDGTRVVVIKKKNHWNRGHHYGWYKHRHHHRGHYGHHHGHGARVVIR